MRAISITALLILAGGPGSTQDAYGTWKMNPSRSRLTSPGTGAITVRIEPHAKGEVFTYERTQKNGQATTFSVVLYFDGRERSSQSGCTGTLLSRRLDSHIAEIVWRCENGSVIRFIRRLGNADDLILDETESQPNHPALERHLVLERQRVQRR